MTWADLLRRAFRVAWIWYRKPATARRIGELERAIERLDQVRLLPPLRERARAHKVEWLHDELYPAAKWNHTQVMERAYGAALAARGILDSGAAAAMRERP